jgi:hypothetical protein
MSKSNLTAREKFQALLRELFQIADAEGSLDPIFKRRMFNEPD